MIARTLIAGLAAAGLMLAVGTGLKYAEGAGVIGHDTAVRTIQVIIGLMLAAYANFMPKSLGSLRGSAAAARWAQSALRVGGWSFAIAGLGYAVIWAVAPMAIADVVSMAIVVSAMIGTLGHAVRARVACRQNAEHGGVP
jgi:hypothetical protein